MSSTTVHSTLAAAKERWGEDHAAFTYPAEGVTLTLGGLEHGARRWASVLIGAGVEPGDRVGICLPGHSAWPQIEIACSMIGAVVIGINTRYRLHEIRHLIEKSRPSALITSKDWRGIPFSALLDEAAIGIDPARIGVDGDAGHGFDDASRLPAAEDESEVDRRAEAVGPGDLALIQFTSGSTSAPKGVMISQETMCRVAAEVMGAAHYEPGEVVYSALPFYHVGGSICTGVGPLVCGARMIVPETFDADDSVRHAIEFGCTAHQGHSAMFTMQIASAQESGLIGDLDIARGWVAAPPSTLRRICDELGAPGIVSVYGMSEYGLVSACDPDDSYEKRTGTVGRPSPGTEVRIAGEDVGEIEVRGSQLMMGYLDDPDATAAAMTADGWFKTGDRARFDEDGYLVFAGREKDMIKPGGENVSAAEIEEFLIEHPEVASVAVIGIPDERLGQVPAAVIEPLPDATVSLDDVRGYCRHRIAGFKTPRVVFTERPMPLLGNGKIDKQSLRAKYGGNGKEDCGGAY